MDRQPLMPTPVITDNTYCTNCYICAKDRAPGAEWFYMGAEGREPICDVCWKESQIVPPDPLPCLDWEKVIKRISLREFPLKVSVEFYREETVNRAFIYCTVPHRDSGEIVKVGAHHFLPNMQKKHEAIKYIHGLIISLVIHELNESFKYNNKRIYDPHKNRY